LNGWKKLMTGAVQVGEVSRLLNETGIAPVVNENESAVPDATAATRLTLALPVADVPIVLADPVT